MQQKSVNQQKTITNHTLVIDNMSKINITGVYEVITATDKAILCKLGTGFLQVGGETLRVEKLMPEEQLLIASGKVYEAKYISGQAKSGFFKKLFR